MGALPSSASSLATRHGPIKNLGASPSKCIDMGSYATNTPVILYPCNGVYSQVFDYDTNDGVIRVAGTGNSKCLDVSGYTAGTPVVIYPCNLNASSQQWTIGGSSGQQIYNYGSAYNMCLDVTSYATGTVVILAPCTGVISQRWQFF